MDNRNDLFHPESVNEQVEHLLCTQDEQQESASSAAVAALKRIYQEDEALLQRAWARIASVEAATHFGDHHEYDHYGPPPREKHNAQNRFFE